MCYNFWILKIYIFYVTPAVSYCVPQLTREHRLFEAILKLEQVVTK